LQGHGEARPRECLADQRCIFWRIGQLRNILVGAVADDQRYPSFGLGAGAEKQESGQNCCNVA